MATLGKTTFSHLFTVGSMSHDQFLEWLTMCVDAGASKALLGRALGATGMAIDRWLTLQRNPSKTVLLLAAHLAQRPLSVGTGAPRPAGEGG